MSIPAESKTRLIHEYRRSDADTGSPEVQIALLSDRIKALTEHFKTHKSDYAARRGLLMMVGRRNTLLKYLKRTAYDRFEQLVKRLGLRAS